MTIPNWKPLQRAEFLAPTDQDINEQARLTGMSSSAVREMHERERRDVQVYRNDLYQVTKRILDPRAKLIHLNIRRVDGAAVRDWRHFQQIKNELLGEECEAVELYPAESRLVDTSNKYHLIGVADPTWRFPGGDIFGNKRDVNYESGSTPGTTQRPLAMEEQEHRLSYGRIYPGKTYGANCTCGWNYKGDGSRDDVYASVREHEDMFL